MKKNKFKYFAKWLPVEGDFNMLKVGEKVFSYGADGDGPSKLLDYTGEELGVCRAKLFLCSRDIQVGDENVKFIGTDGKCNDWYVTKPTESDSRRIREWQEKGAEVFKVIGEISPDAYSYVKEGDEFNEDNIWFIGIHRSFPDMNTTSTTYEEHKIDLATGKYTTVCKIKGQCGHFH